jgi:uncharacterized membrane protein YobD (UPF0266 family)
MEYWSFNMIENNEKVKDFLTRVERQVYTENSAIDIRSELLDHIESLTEDYHESGLNEDISISKALLQMGDPQEIGYGFTDYEGMKKRRNIILFFKYSSIFLLLITFVPFFIKIDGSSGDILKKENLRILPNFFNLFLIFYSASLMLGHSMKYLEIDTTPFAIVWPVKERFKWEYFLSAIFFLPIVIVFIIIYFYEEGLTGHAFFSMWPLVTLSYSIFAIFYKEKFRIPKVVLLNEGFIIKGRFVSFTRIATYTWTKDFLSKDQCHYKLILDLFQPQNGQKGLRKTISVHKRQQSYMREFLKEKLS